MLFKVDTIYGHVVEDTAEGPIYRDDGSRVDPKNLRPCLGCGVHIQQGTHDPCIAGLPKTSNACCGHGLDRKPVSGNPSGYVALEDGRTFRFSGLVGGTLIRAAVEAAIKDEPLPDGFVYDEDKAWWSGLSEDQRNYVLERIPAGLIQLVREVTTREPPAEVLSGEKMWWHGLTDAEKETVWGMIPAMQGALVEEALRLA